jgi:parvulin-like peptidyl-prolyl isomerase
MLKGGHTVRHIFFLFLISFLVISSSCERKTPAVVNGEKITQKMLDDAVAGRMKEHKGTSVSEKAIRQAALEQLIAQRLIIQGAKEAKVSVSDDEVQKEMERMKNAAGEETFKRNLKNMGMTLDDFKKKSKEAMLINKFAETLFPESAITENDLAQYYKTSPMPFLKPARVYVRFIETATEEQANAILNEMKEKKAGFDDVADRVEKGKKATVSSYGWTQPEFFKNDIAKALGELNAGQYGGPYKGKEGFYIINVKQREKSTVKSFEEAKGDVRARLLGEKRQAAVDSWILEKRKTAKIKLNIS